MAMRITGEVVLIGTDEVAMIGSIPCPFTSSEEWVTDQARNRNPSTQLSNWEGYVGGGRAVKASKGTP